jgi:S-adenosylmethionine:tRNA ribosyltransferase-isomerase
VKTSQFSFELPDDLIAQLPAVERESARMLVVNRIDGSTVGATVRDLPLWVDPGTVVVLNDTRVRKARIFAERARGAKAEFVLLRQVEPGLWETLAGRIGRAKAGTRFPFPDGIQGTLETTEGETRLIRFEPPIDEAWLEKNGHVPLPPYIRRPDDAVDEQRYQTVYARVTGSAAAPTAGLHFTPRLLDALRKRGAQVTWVTLHVGLGTFLPIRAEQIEDHPMHEEAYTIPPEAKRLVDAAVKEGRQVLAVGTTVVRTLESAWTEEGLQQGPGWARIYITPGFRFRVVSRLFTNFHTPESSLLVLVSAFAGPELVLRTYAHAVQERYRFFSYGDAMLIR